MNKYNGDGSLKEEAQTKVLLGLVKVGDEIKIEFEKTQISELARFWGILSIEVPFLLQQLKAMEAKKNASGIVTPR